MKTNQKIDIGRMGWKWIAASILILLFGVKMILGGMADRGQRKDLADSGVSTLGRVEWAKYRGGQVGNKATVYHFAGNMGHPVATQDAIDELYFFKISRGNFIVTRVHDGGDGSPVASEIGDNLTDLWTIQSITDEKGKGDTFAEAGK